MILTLDLSHVEWKTLERILDHLAEDQRVPRRELVDCLKLATSGRLSVGKSVEQTLQRVIDLELDLLDRRLIGRIQKSLREQARPPLLSGGAA